MSPTIEIVKFVAKDSYKQDPTILNDALEILKNTSGTSGIWHGLEIQEPKYLYIVVVWETLQHHQALIDDKEAYAKLGAAIQKAAADKQYLYHVNYSAEIYTALDAPVTEFAIWTINQGTPREQFKACLGEIIARADADPTLKDEVFRGSWGAIVEDERKFMVTLGWHSLERFSAAVYNAKELVELITSVKQLAELDLKHTKLTKFWKE